MYEIKIESEEFKEKRTVQQHQMVNQVSKGNYVPLLLACSVQQGLLSGDGILLSALGKKNAEAQSCKLDSGPEEIYIIWN